MRNGSVVILRSYVSVRQVLAYHGLPRVRATEQNPMQICWKHSRDARGVLTRYLAVRYVRRQIDLPSLPSCLAATLIFPAARRPRKPAAKCHYGNAIYRARKDVDDRRRLKQFGESIRRIRGLARPSAERIFLSSRQPWKKKKTEIFMRLFCRCRVMRFRVACSAMRASQAGRVNREIGR